MKQSIFRLLTKHQKLDDALRSEQTRPWPDGSRIAQLKKLKLAVKDRLYMLSIRRRKVSA